MLFTGEQYDAKARGPGPNGGLYYLRARYYDPGIGRFLSQDPLPMGNLYAYVGNNPVNFVDPSWLCHEGPLVILKGEKGPYYAPIFTSKQEEVGFKTYGDCISAHECKLVLEQYCGSTCKFVCVKGLVEKAREFLTTECAQGIIAAGLAMAIVTGSVYSGVVFVQAGGIITTSAAGLATSATGLAVVSLGPEHSAKILQLSSSAVGAVEGIQECA